MSDSDLKEVVQPEVVEEKPKKEKRIAQLAEARQKKAQKKAQDAEERQRDKKRLEELEQRLTQSAIAKKEASDSDTEPDEPPQKKQVVTKQESTQEVEGPSLMDEIKKNFILAGLGVGSFLVARYYSAKPSAPAIANSPAPAKRPAPSATDGFIAPPPTKRRIVPNVQFSVPEPKTPVGTSGFFQ